jgi:hypothetical protein
MALRRALGNSQQAHRDRSVLSKRRRARTASSNRKMLRTGTMKTVTD